MFKRRPPRSLRERIGRLWPKKGWLRAGSYILYRIRRLPDPPHRIARGVAAGVFASFTPLFGLHFVLAGIIALAIRGNVIAAMLGTAVGNPVTFPFIASMSVELGLWILGLPGHMPPARILGAFTQATVQLSENFAALFTGAEAHWTQLGLFFERVFWPYLVGGFLPGLLTAVVCYMLTNRLATAYQRLRQRRHLARIEKRHAALHRHDLPPETAPDARGAPPEAGPDAHPERDPHPAPGNSG